MPLQSYICIQSMVLLFQQIHTTELSSVLSLWTLYIEIDHYCNLNTTILGLAIPVRDSVVAYAYSLEFAMLNNINKSWKTIVCLVW